MSSGTKVALVALMVLVMVVIAKLVNDESDGTGPVAGAAPQTGSAESDAGKGSATVDPRQAGLGAQVTGRSTQRPAQRSSNPPPARLVRPREDSSAARSGRSSSASAARRPSTRRDPRLSLRGADVGGPIFSEPPGERATANASRGSGSTRSPAAPISVGQQGSGERTSRDTSRAPATGAIVETQLGQTLTPGRAPSALPGSRGATSGSTGARSTPGSSERRSGRSASGSGSVRLKSFDLSKAPRTSTAGEADTRRAAVSTSNSTFPLSYTIQPNDSLWKIAEKYYGGRGYLYTHIAKGNPGVKVQPGKVLVIPPPPAPRKTASKTSTTTGAVAQPSKKPSVRRSANVPTRGSATARPRSSSSTTTRYHTVQRGETLWEIARSVYGDPTQYVRIKNANPQLKNPDKVKAGTKIVLP